MGMERIIIDMDEVIADPMGAMVTWYEENHPLKVNFDNIKEGSWVRGFPEEHHQLCSFFEIHEMKLYMLYIYICII
jgi:hypothetical protein